MLIELADLDSRSLHFSAHLLHFGHHFELDVLLVDGSSRDGDFRVSHLGVAARLFVEVLVRLLNNEVAHTVDFYEFGFGQASAALRGVGLGVGLQRVLTV